MALVFRNLDVSPVDPVEDWGFEGLLTAVERGDISDWRRVAAAVARSPRGEVAERLDRVFEVAEDSGVVGALRQYVAMVRDASEERERRAVADELRALWRASGLDQATYARRLGTSRSRLNTYLNARTVPLATFMVRARALRPEPDATAT